MLNDLTGEKLTSSNVQITSWIAMQPHAVFGPSAYLLNKELNLVFH